MGAHNICFQRLKMFSCTINDFMEKCFHREIRKILCGYPFLSGAMLK